MNDLCNRSVYFTHPNIIKEVPKKNRQLIGVNSSISNNDVIMLKWKQKFYYNNVNAPTGRRSAK